MRSFFLQPIHDITTGFENVLAANRRAFVALLVMLLAMAATWWTYVPIHEFLHVVGCVVTGGSVSELQIAPRYGGALFARLFPFVVSDGDYAGRLTGFDTHGSDLIYLATDFGPFVLSVLIGIPLLKFAIRRSSPALLGVSIVLALPPIYNVTGDYYEMGSIITTRCTAVLSGDATSVYRAAVRGDDVFRLAGDLWSDPAALGLQTRGDFAGAAGLMAVSQILAVFLGLATYWLGCRFAALLGCLHAP